MSCASAFGFAGRGAWGLPPPSQARRPPHPPGPAIRPSPHRGLFHRLGRNALRTRGKSLPNGPLLLRNPGPGPFAGNGLPRAAAPPPAGGRRRPPTPFLLCFSHHFPRARCGLPGIYFAPVNKGRPTAKDSRRTIFKAGVRAQFPSNRLTSSTRRTIIPPFTGVLLISFSTPFAPGGGGPILEDNTA